MIIKKESWRGKNFLSKIADGNKYVTMCGPDSVIYFPVSVSQNTKYYITIVARKESGNGILFCNLFGSKIFDFKQVKIECKENFFEKYKFEIESGSFPKTMPISFRLFRGGVGTGNISIDKIFVDCIVSEELEKQNNTIHKINLEEKKIDNVFEEIEVEKKIDNGFEEIEVEKKSFCAICNLSNECPGGQKVFEHNIVSDTKVSVVISIYNRLEFFERTLYSYVWQSLPKNNFEIIVVDDKSTENIKEVCKEFSNNFGLRFKYILIDKEKGFFKPKSFTPALSNNLGIKNSKGEVVVISGPETLICENSLKESYLEANKDFCIYGSVYRSSNEFVQQLKEDSFWYLKNFKSIIEMPGAKDDCSVLSGWWWYYVAIRKEHLLAIHGVDERFMMGITGEDDNFALRIKEYGVPLLRSNTIFGIHQDHSEVDKEDCIHSFRYNNKSEWNTLRQHNIGLLKSWNKEKNPIANIDIDWGTSNAIIYMEEF